MLAFNLIVFASLCCVSSAYTWNDRTPIDDYVQFDDGYYSWEYTDQYDYDGVTIWLTNMTSQKYQDESYSSQPVWYHYGAVACPNEVRHKKLGFLYLGGMANEDGAVGFPLPKFDAANIAIVELANDTGTCGGYIFQIPNQPMVFYNDPNLVVRKECSIITWTWRDWLDDPAADPSIIMRMPMTKAAKRGLDMIHDVAKDKVPDTHIDQFAVVGWGKHGWTAWSLAATDRRVIAVIPVVFTLLNMPENFMNHYRDLDGGWSFAMVYYYNENITRDLLSPRMDGIYDVEDMYRYRDRFANVSKLVITASGDEQMLPDPVETWWNDLPGQKFLSIIPNAQHMLINQRDRAEQTITAYIQSIFEGIPLPQVSWIMQDTGAAGLIVVDTIPMPESITAWSAVTLSNETRKDYRMEILGESGMPTGHGVRWYEDVNVVDFLNGYQYGASAEKVDGEWIAYYIDMIYRGPAPTYYPLYLSTQINVLPYTRPRGPCVTNEECYGVLV